MPLSEVDLENIDRLVNGCMEGEHANVLDGRCLDCGVEIPGHSWQPRSLLARAAIPPEPPTIGGLLYPAKRTLLSGETESLKTWSALILAKAEMDAGYAVAWADLDAMGAGELLARFQALGVSDDVIDELFLYYEPEERLIDDLLEEVCETIAYRGVRLFVIDAFNPILNLHGLDPGSTSDIETFWREVATPITRAGAAPTLLDHVAKNAESRGKYAYGSERKASGAIVHIGFALEVPLKRGGSGRTRLITHKDRPGFLPRPTIGKLTLDSDGELVTYSLQRDRSHDGAEFRPTVLMERVSRKVEPEFEVVSKNWIEENVTGNRDAVRLAIDVLVEEGFLEESRGSRGARLFRSARPYREDADDFQDGVYDDDATSPRPRPDLALDLKSIPSSTSPKAPPYGGDGRGGDDLAHSPRPDLALDSVAMESPKAAPECEKHPGARHWRTKLDSVWCAECIPPLDEYAVVEWLEAAP